MLSADSMDENNPDRDLLHRAAHAVQDAVEHPAEFGARQWSGFVLGPALLAITLIVAPPEGLSQTGWRTAGAAMLMAVWWITEAVPIPVTALVPLALFPLLGLGTIKDVAAPYANPLVFLFLGGFVIALAMQRWNLHRRLAINIIGAMGTRPTRIVAGFLLSGALVSMWVSNTATALMMLPIATSVVAILPEKERRKSGRNDFGSALMLAVAYGATTGGMATLIGTPPNALLAGFMSRVYGYEIGFAQWMLIGVPVTAVSLPVVYWILTRVSFKLDPDEVPGMAELIASEKSRLGKPGRGEITVAIVFALTALAWIFNPMFADRFPLLTDTTVAIAGAIALFLIPVDVRRGEFAMNWQATKGLPWDVLVLFGGGLSLASAIQGNGVSDYLGKLAGGLSTLPVIAAVAIVCFGILMLTELTSNTATAATFLPISAAIAVSLGQNPMLFAVPTALAATCSYMLPVGTPPNAIVFGSGMVRLPQMARAGMLMNLALVPIIVGLLWLLGPFVFGIQHDVIPSWVK